MLGACLLHVCISAALYRPLATHVVILRRKERASNGREDPEPGEKLKDEIKQSDNVSRVILRSDVNKYGRADSSCAYGDNKSEASSVELPNLSSSLPNHTVMGPHCINDRFMNEECCLASKRNSIHSSFDSISMMSSVSQEHGEVFGPSHWSGRTSPTGSNAQVQGEYFAKIERKIGVSSRQIRNCVP